MGSREFFSEFCLKMSAKRGADDRAEAELGERPGGVLARAAAAEIIAGEQHLSALRARLVEDEIGLGMAFGVVAPVVEELLVEALLGRGFQEARGNNLVGIDVVDGQRHDAAFEIGEGLHRRVLTSVTTPVSALAAAVSGLARKVRPPLPWRPSKLRLLVETLYWPGESWSPFMAMHMEQPGSRQSQPAARKISGSPSAIGLALDFLRAGHHHHADLRIDLAALEQAGGDAQIGDARVGAASDEDHVDGMAEERLAAFEAHVAQRLGDGIALHRVGHSRGLGQRAR